MKKFLPATLAIAIVATCWALWSSRSPLAAIARISPAERDHRQPPPVIADALPTPATPLAESGVVLSVPGLPPVFLASAADAPWEKTIDTLVIRADLSDALKARTLIQMLPGLPEEAVTKAAEEATARLSDADYRAVLLPTLLDPQTNPRTMSVLFADLMERPAAIALPILHSIARDPRHSYAPFAQENLELLLDRNFGTDWAKWEAAIREHVGALRR